MKPKTFIILSPGFPKNETDSTCLPFLQNFVVELNNQFPTIEIVLLAFDYPFVAKEYSWHDTKVFSFNGWQKKIIGKLLKWRNVWRRLAEYNKNSEVMGLLSLWCGECAYIATLFSRSNKLLHYCWVLGQDAKPGNKYVKRIGPREEDLIAISDFIQREFEKNYSIRPHQVIPVGIKPENKESTDKKRDIDIMGAGSLITLKRYDLLIEVVYEVSKSFPEIQVVVAGRGPEMENLKKMVATLGLEKNITLTGEMSHAEVLEMMTRAKVFLHPSNYEGLGAVCLEALQAGCHLISFVRSVEDNFDQWYIVESKEKMIAKIISLLGNPTLQFESTRTFTIEESVRRVMSLYS
jgi:glycosyltransferase involved in cell wall biosynthesis